jgi:hypothetical protein
MSCTRIPDYKTGKLFPIRRHAHQTVVIDDYHIIIGGGFRLSEKIEN